MLTLRENTHKLITSHLQTGVKDISVEGADKIYRMTVADQDQSYYYRRADGSVVTNPVTIHEDHVDHFTAHHSAPNNFDPVHGPFRTTQMYSGSYRGSQPHGLQPEFRQRPGYLPDSKHTCAK